MEWRGRRQSDNVDDLRGSDGGSYGGGGFRFPIGGGGGLGIGGIVVVLFLSWVTGINPLTLLAGADAVMNGSPSRSTQQQPARPPANDEMTAFVRTILAETEDTWTDIFRANGQTYKQPRLTLFSRQVQSACGFASSATGPFYCPSDNRVYLDTSFFRQLSQQFGASGDFAQAYVIAHEVGHHVQNLLGIMAKYHQVRSSMNETEANRMSVRVELQADCFAGVWGKHTEQKGILDQGDLQEALNAAQQIGDDTLQRRGQGYVVPESFSHGTSAQRKRWFQRGFSTGSMRSCDTFSPVYQQL